MLEEAERGRNRWRNEAEALKIENEELRMKLASEENELFEVYGETQSLIDEIERIHYLWGGKKLGAGA